MCRLPSPWANRLPPRAGPLAAEPAVDVVIGGDALQLRRLGEPRHVVEDERFLGQQRGDHQGQRGILRARNSNGAVELAAPDNTNAVHATPLLCTNYRP